MWLCDLPKIFCTWLFNNKQYDFRQAKSKKTRLVFYEVTSIAALVICSIAGSKLTPTDQTVKAILYYGLIADVIIYFYRILMFRKRTNESNLFRAIHALLHWYIIGAYFNAIAYASQVDLGNDDALSLSNLYFVFAFLSIRILVYSTFITLLILFSPWILYAIIKNRREERIIGEYIRQARNSGEAFGIRDSLRLYNDGQQDAFGYQQIDNERAGPVDEQALRNEVDAILRDNQFNDSFLELLRNLAPAGNVIANFDNLKRVTFEDEKDRLPYEDCSICVMPFSDWEGESLIYLPCNRHHIFHENCILEWLKRKKDCPLCKAPLTDAAMANYPD